MEKVRELLEKELGRDTIHAIISNPRKKQNDKKIVFRPFEEKGELYFQKERFSGNQVFHTNCAKEEAVEEIIGLLQKEYKQLNLCCQEKENSVLVSKKGVSTIKERKNETIKPLTLSHNRKKKYILDTDEVLPFLVDLGVQTKEGKIVDKKYKKYKQINRFLEFVKDVLPELPKDRPVKIIDFGCGKSYLTFAVYYYLHIMNGRDVEMIGLDLKKDVIAHCNRMAEKYEYTSLHFLEGDISTYDGADSADMVITLHACDVATDFALDKAVHWNAKVILSVPCCQHELNAQIENDMLEPLLKYGILKERFAALLTDALRANLLEQNGYEVQILEFIDMEHTPKNLLIRAVKRGEKADKKQEKLKNSYKTLCDELNAHGTLEKILKM